MKFDELIDALRAQAIANSLSPTSESVYRKICRAYSKKFNTPLHEVYSLSPEHVILNHYEDELDDIDTEEHIETLLDRIYSIEDPEYEAQKKEDFDAFAEQAEEEERKRLESGKPIHPALKNESTLKNTPKKEEPPKEELPKGGYVNLSYLEDEESGGFEE